MSVARLLKEETHSEHQHAESVLKPQLERLSGKDQYGRLLRRFYGFYHPVQQLALQKISPLTLHDKESRNTSELILKDLQSMGFSIENIPLSDELPSLENEAEAMGVMYVLEGSNLGGKIIRKMLLTNSLLDVSDDSVNFFNGYGEDTRTKWLSFLDGLETQDDHETVLRSARSGFQTFTKWISTI